MKGLLDLAEKKKTGHGFSHCSYLEVCLWFIFILLCCSVSLQVIQTIRAMDRDNFANGRFTFALPADIPANPNFTLKDNEGTKVRN